MDGPYYEVVHDFVLVPENLTGRQGSCPACER
jgi:hypothetical protein